MTVEQDSLSRAATEYLAAGLCTLPAKRLEKRPAVGSWKRYQKRLPTEAELSAWMANHPDGICILCGSVSGNAEMIDFDAGGDRFMAWWDRLPADLRERLVVETTPAGGMHVTYRCQVPICGNLKLAQRQVGDQIKTLIETRGEGGLFLCAPTPGYMLAHGDYANLPVLTEAERNLLLQTAWDLNEYVPPVIDGPGSASHSATSPRTAASCVALGAQASHPSHIAHGAPVNADRPGDDFNHRGNLRNVLEQQGWVLVKPGENEYWRRPGKDCGTSATLRACDGRLVFYVFSANAAPFEPNRAYSPFAVYTMLNHGGDFEQAARSLRQLGYGDDGATDAAHNVDISALVQMSAAKGDCASHSGTPGCTSALTGEQPPGAPEIVDPGPMSDDMLHIPGFVAEVMDHCLATAPYPNPVLAFCGALSLLAFLAGRKVRDSGDNRTNIYLLGLAHSSAGKDWPRKINTSIAHEVGLADALGQHFASGEGIQDALFQTPSMLFQTDEIDGMLQSINKAKDARHEAVMSTMLTMYSSANSVFPMRRKANASGKAAKPPGVINQPCLVIFGTAIPNHYYEALSERMLTNGFFARMIILEAGHRGTGQEPAIRDLPQRVLETARWWANYQPGERRGNLLEIHPVPAIVEHTDEAKRVLVETRLEAEAQYSAAEARGDPVGTTVWGRVSEQTRKLALLYAISKSHQSPSIGIDAVRWASSFVMHQTRRMLFMASAHVADNPFHAECLKALEKLRAAPGGELPHSVLLKRMKMDAKTFTVLIETLIQQGDIEVVTASTLGRSMRAYRLIGAANEAGETSAGGER